MVGVMVTMCAFAYFAHSIYYAKRQQVLLKKANTYDLIVAELVSVFTHCYNFFLMKFFGQIMYQQHCGTC